MRLVTYRHDGTQGLAVERPYGRLLPAGIIATGTPSGVLVYQQPPNRLRDGDIVTIDIEGIGALTNRCREVPSAV